MKLRDELKESRTENGKPGYEIQMMIQDLSGYYGLDEEGPWLLVWTAFHGGGIVSKHKTATAAAKAKRRHKSDDCTCGCTKIIAASDVEELPTADNASSPYHAAV